MHVIACQITNYKVYQSWVGLALIYPTSSQNRD